MMFSSPDAYDAWLNRPYVDGLRVHVGDREARRILTEEEVEREVQEALDEIAAIAEEDRDPPPEPDDPDDDFDDDDDIDRGGEG